jgi:hypothetical protein
LSFNSNLEIMLKSSITSGRNSLFSSSSLPLLSFSRALAR